MARFRAPRPMERDRTPARDAQPRTRAAGCSGELTARQLMGFGDATGFGGGMAGEGTFRWAPGRTSSPSSRGWEGDMCDAPHWGYLPRGRVTVVTYLDRTEETCSACDLFYWLPGHSVRVTADAEVILFSPEAVDGAAPHGAHGREAGRTRLVSDADSVLDLHDVDGGAQLGVVVPALGGLVSRVAPLPTWGSPRPAPRGPRETCSTTSWAAQ